ncbi:MAG: GAF domain-containing protein [Armatimonadota bacterium]
MKDEGSGTASPGSLPEQLLTATEQLVEDWLRTVGQPGDGLPGASGRRRLRRAVLDLVKRPPGAPGPLFVALPAQTLRLAASSLKRALEGLELTDGEAREARRHIVLACDLALGTPCQPAAGQDCSAGIRDLVSDAARRIARTTTVLTAKRVLVRSALRICDARLAAWWDQRAASRFRLAAALGGGLPAEAADLRIAPNIWKAPSGRSGLLLSPEVEEQQAVLAAVRAETGVLISAVSAGKTIGLLGVFDGRYDEGRLRGLFMLAQQAAAGVHALELAAEQKQLGETRQRTVAELGFALGSALSLDELLELVCRSAVELAEADAGFVYLAEQGGQLSLRAANDRELRAGLGSSLDQFAEQTRAQPLGHPLVRQKPEGGSVAGYRSLVGLALAVRGEPVGALVVASGRPGAFGRARRAALSLFAAQAAVAIENLRLVEDMQRRLLEMADLTWVSNRVISTMEVARIAATVAEAAAKALEAPRSALFLANERGELAPLAQGQHGLADEGTEALPASGHLGGEAMAMGVPQIVSDAVREGKSEDALVRWLGARSLLCVPMAAQQGLRGILVIADVKPREFPSHAVALLSAYGNQTALALQSAMLYQGALRHLDQLQKLSDISQALTSSLELTQTLQRVLDSAAELVDAPVGTLMLLDPGSDELVMKATKGVGEDEDFLRPLKLGEGLAGRAAQSGAPLLSSDISRDGRFAHRERAREGGLQAAMAAPLITRGRTVGVLNLYRRSSRPFDEEEKRVVMSLANNAAVAIENARLYEETEERAQFLNAMVSEINHRVRNTLQAVAGLLRMEMEQQPPRSIGEVLKRGIARLQSIAVVHDTLHGSDLHSVDMKQAARRIVQLTTQVVAPGAQIEASVSGTRVMLPSQQATNVAMILSELVDNAIRHGLSGVEGGRIMINLTEVGGDVVIEVTDNGVGLPDRFELERHSGLGMKIVRGLVEEELDGALEIEGNGGVTIRAKFPKHAR